MNEHADETALIRREAAKKGRHLSVRQLLALAPNVLTTLKPCWTMSPILVSEMIPIEPRLFDVVIFDEASQIPPAEAVGRLGACSAGCHSLATAGSFLLPLSSKSTATARTTMTRTIYR